MSPEQTTSRRCVRDAMTTPVVAVRPDARLEEVAHTLATKQIGAVPVVDRREHVVGVVTEADLLLGSEGRRSTAAEVMSAPVVVVEPETLLESAQHAMLAHRVGRLPVVDRQRRLIGILTRRDVLSAMLPADLDICRAVSRRVADTGGEVVAVTVIRGAVWMRVRISDPEVLRDLESALRDVDGVIRLDLDVEPAQEHGRASAPLT